MTHTLITMTRYAGIVLSNDFFSQPTYDPTFVIHSIVPLIHLSHARHSFVICANYCIIAESFPVMVTNHTSQSFRSIYMCK